jgi:hypothetical protein
LKGREEKGNREKGGKRLLSVIDCEQKNREGLELIRDGEERQREERRRLG